MNAVAANSSASQIGNGILAAFAHPGASPAANTQTSPTFLSIVSLLFSPSDQASLTSSTGSINAGSPAQIADAMIRSMLENTSPANANGTPPNLTANPPVSSAPLNLTPRKQGRGMVDLLPQMTAMANVPLAQVLPPPAPVTAAPAPQTSQAPADLNAAPTSSLSGWTAARVQTSTPIATPALNVAFTAVLTPMKDMAPADLKACTLAQVSVSQPPASPLPAASSDPAASTNQPMKADAGNQTLNSQAAQGASPDSSGQSSGNATQQQQQQNDSSANTKPTLIASDAKAKAQIAKSADDSAQAPAAQATVTDRPVALTSLASTTPAATISPRTEAPSSAPANATEAMRNSEPSAPAPEPLRTGAAQEITIRIAPPNASPVDLRVIERSGQVHVDVRTADASMQTSLRQDLGTLTTSLQRAGYHAETFTPSMVAGRAVSSTQNNHEGQQDSSQQRNGSGESPADRRQQQRQKQTGHWLEEQENQK